ncbi:MAG: aminoglycoside phosphotransferase family protein [Eubacteriales bacterium]
MAGGVCFNSYPGAKARMLRQYYLLCPKHSNMYLGMKAGQLLRKLHSLPAPENTEPWGVRFRRKVDTRIDFYTHHPIKSDNADMVIRYLTDNQTLLDSRPQTFNHGDFNTTNLFVSPDGEVGIIDFNYFNSDHGDPWWEFCFVDPTIFL